MRSGNRLVLAAALVWLTATAVSATVHPKGSPGTLSTQGTSGTHEYVGSSACAPCHETAQAQWERSLHVRMTKPIAEATILGDFRAASRFSVHGRSYEFGMRDDGRPFVRVSAGERPPETYAVDYTLGWKRYQGYLSTLPDGRIYVLPVFWHVQTRRWLDWKEITPIPDGAHDMKQIWNANCFNCHATNLAQGFDVASKTYKTTWTEMGIGCEACHGPGRAHIELMEAWEKNPGAKPAYDRSAKNRDLSAQLEIFSPRTADRRQVFDTCAYCHGNKTNAFVGFSAGDRYEDYALPFFISAPIPETDFQGEFWPDGRPNRFNRPQALTLSGCFKAGAIACTNCHIAHGSSNGFSLKLDPYRERYGDLLCTQCHTGPATGKRQPATGGRVGSRTPDTPASRVPWTDAEIERHTYHAAESAGSRCVTCHMADVNWRLLIRRRDHTFQPPVPEMTASVGVPNACTTCHDDRTPEWAAAQMDAWWGDGDRRKAAVELADVMYRAGSGDRSAIPALTELAIDRSNGALIRASAVDFIRQLAISAGRVPSVQSQSSFGAERRIESVAPVGSGSLPREVINTLIGAAADPEPMVRAAAVRALAAGGRQNVVVAAVLARLVDQARVVRAYAAGVLLGLGVSTLPGRAGEALARAQDELALSLGMFPDSAQQQAQLGWLEGERGRADAARQALDAAIDLDPAYARPMVLKGVLAARENKFDEAIALWRKARSLEPSYPNIDKLIEEAEKRKLP